MPTDYVLLCNWVTHLADVQKVLYKTIKTYLTGVRSAHIDAGFTDVDSFSNDLLQRVVQGIRRQQGDPNRKERLPITRDLLLQIVHGFDSTTRFGATMHAAFCLAFAAFLRVGEFTYDQDDLSPDFSKYYLTRSSVTFHHGHMNLNLPGSKTDAFRRGVNLTIARASDEACPIRSLTNLFSRYPDSPYAPLFFTSAAPFTRKLVVDTLHKSLMNLGIQGKYSGHSFRRGAATSAHRAGLEDAMIQVLGRWRSDAYKLYIDIKHDVIIDASRRHQQA